MAAGGYLGNDFFYYLAYSVDQPMLTGVLGDKEFIFGIFLMIPPYFDREIQDGCRSPSWKLHYCCVLVSTSG